MLVGVFAGFAGNDAGLFFAVTGLVEDKSSPVRDLKLTISRANPSDIHHGGRVIRQSAG
jgi:hypothetical protein